jgi:hypothetical protein
MVAKKGSRRKKKTAARKTKAPRRGTGAKPKTATVAIPRGAGARAARSAPARSRTWAAADEPVVRLELSVRSLFVSGVPTRGGDLITLLAHLLRQPASKIPGAKIKDLAVCDDSLRADISTAINRAWPNLLPPFTSVDVLCADTSDDLEGRIASRTR